MASSAYSSLPRPSTESSRSSRSFDIDEAKHMFLRDAPSQPATYDTSEGVILSRRRSFLGQWIAPCSVVLNVLLFGVLLWVLGDPCGRGVGSKRCVYVEEQEKLADEPKFLGEIKGLVPEFKLETVTFMNDSRFANENMFIDKGEHQKILDQWEGDMPRGRGFVYFNNTDTSHLARPFHISKYEQRDGYSIASYHQYHCLWMIMRGYGGKAFNTTVGGADQERHVTHCFDYLRQSVLCAGDSALEGQSEMVHGMADGWGNQHVCRSIKDQNSWIDKNRLSDYTGIH